MHAGSARCDGKRPARHTEESTTTEAIRHGASRRFREAGAYPATPLARSFLARTDGSSSAPRQGAPDPGRCPWSAGRPPAPCQWPGSPRPWPVTTSQEVSAASVALSCLCRQAAQAGTAISWFSRSSLHFCTHLVNVALLAGHGD